ncbi:ABC transporter ATP-binding protein [Paralimibaculum aggregatum]|uniref:ABC transporter ATP-binding protein n=1 Tax=Paralimibaculum aggregatum TaxID=3036245 RepID=A0ABQ6LJJ5_9RHOB|nr:ATP-binding cassette domain-containing protein [Limibaculum sp. NKW23]GMG82415.1 ABC transporter ATP-binding protein [Limibaculum sp. NKW23]
MTQPPALSLAGSATIGGEPLFRDIAFAVPAGRWTCLLGPSGVGKTTVLRLFAGLATGVVHEGTCAASDGPLAGRVALMAQDDLLLPWLDLIGNATLGARLRGEAADTARAREVLAAVGLAGMFHRRPRELSGGQRQRAALARTLMEDRPVVLLDEPFSALDARTRAQMQELTARLLAGRTVLLVTHDPAEAARLGDVIRIMTEDGIEEVPPPPGAPPRPVDDEHVLWAQASLLARLRKES